MVGMTGAWTAGSWLLLVFGGAIVVSVCLVRVVIRCSLCWVSDAVQRVVPGLNRIDHSQGTTRLIELAINRHMRLVE